MSALPTRESTLSTPEATFPPASLTVLDQARGRADVERSNGSHSALIGSLVALQLAWIGGLVYLAHRLLT